MTISVERAAPEAYASVDLRMTPGGVPLAVRFEGRVWAVAAEPFHWFSRTDWWTKGRAVPKGAGDVVSVEYWRIQARLSSRSALRTFIVRREPQSQHWILETLDDRQD